ncbi:insecticidal delta-endotoxin Cry8Ea1 family protein [Bacillus cereus]
MLVSFSIFAGGKSEPTIDVGSLFEAMKPAIEDMIDRKLEATEEAHFKNSIDKYKTILGDWQDDLDLFAKDKDFNALQRKLDIRLSLMSTDISEFTTEGYELIGLPYYTVAATMHLMLLSDRFRNLETWGYDTKELETYQDTFKDHMARYSDYIINAFHLAWDANKQAQTDEKSYMNEQDFINGMIINCFDYMRVWPLMAPEYNEADSIDIEYTRVVPTSCAAYFYNISGPLQDTNASKDHKHENERVYKKEDYFYPGKQLSGYETARTGKVDIILDRIGMIIKTYEDGSQIPFGDISSPGSERTKIKFTRENPIVKAGAAINTAPHEGPDEKHYSYYPGFTFQYLDDSIQSIPYYIPPHYPYLDTIQPPQPSSIIMWPILPFVGLPDHKVIDTANEDNYVIGPQTKPGDGQFLLGGVDFVYKHVALDLYPENIIGVPVVIDDDNTTAIPVKGIPAEKYNRDVGTQWVQDTEWVTGSNSMKSPENPAILTISVTNITTGYYQLRYLVATEDDNISLICNQEKTSLPNTKLINVRTTTHLNGEGGKKYVLVDGPTFLIDAGDYHLDIMNTNGSVVLSRIEFIPIIPPPGPVVDTIPQQDIVSDGKRTIWENSTVMAKQAQLIIKLNDSSLNFLDYNVEFLLNGVVQSSQGMHKGKFLYDPVQQGFDEIQLVNIYYPDWAPTLNLNVSVSGTIYGPKQSNPVSIPLSEFEAMDANTIWTSPHPNKAFKQIKLKLTSDTDNPDDFSDYSMKFLLNNRIQAVQSAMNGEFLYDPVPQGFDEIQLVKHFTTNDMLNMNLKLTGTVYPLDVKQPVFTALEELNRIKSIVTSLFTSVSHKELAPSVTSYWLDQVAMKVNALSDTVFKKRKERITKFNL